MSKWKLGKIVKRYGGGGGGGTTTTVTQNIPEEFRPALRRAQERAEEAYLGGKLDNVAGVSNLQEKAFGMGDTIQQVGQSGLTTLQQQNARLTDMANTGGANELQAALDLDVGMGAAKIGQDYGASGTLGSYRQNLANATSEDATKAKFAQQVIQNKAAAEQGLNTNAAALSADQANLLKSLEATGAAERGIDQQQLDANWQAYQRLASSMYGNPARQQTVAVPGSSGGK